MEADTSPESVGSSLPTARVAVTPEAADLLRRLRADHDQPLMFHQSGGCCDGSAPMCYTQGTLLIGAADVLLGELDPGTPEPVPVWISAAQFAYWSHTHITIDVVPGRGAGFSIEGPTGHRFIIRSRVFTEEETARMGPVVRGGVAS